MNLQPIFVFLSLSAACLMPLCAQTTAVFPAEYAAVAEGPLNAPNLPLANGVSRTLLVYDRADLAVPAGAAITHLGFRQDATLTVLDVGRTLQLEVRVGTTTQSATALSSTLAANYQTAPTTVFGPAPFALPNLRDAANPLPNGQFFVPFTTPFVLQATGNLVVECWVHGTSGGGASFNYRLDRADFHSPVVLGPAGCQHSGGRTAQLNLQPVRIGSSLAGTLSAAPANSFAVIAVAVGGGLVAPYALDPLVPGVGASCTGQLPLAGLATLSGVTTAQGGLNFSYAIPNQIGLNDMHMAHQAILFDFFAPGGLAVSNGADVQIGIRPRASCLAAQGPPSTVTTGTVTANYCPVTFFRW